MFSLAEREHAGAYTIELVTASGEAFRTSSGLQLTPDSAAAVVPGTDRHAAGGRRARGADGRGEDEALISWLRLAARRSRRVGSVCTGAFLLARAGLLDGRRATTHWTACSALRRTYPTVEVESDPIFVRDGNVYTSAGVSAGIDLALALVEEDLGSSAALAVARELVLFIRRPGGQAQFSAGLAGQSAQRPSLRALQDWIADHLDADLSVAALAERSFMSQRNFARVFAGEVGMTPAAYVESLRLERARTLLESTDAQLEEVAARCGFGTVETLRRTFGRRLDVSPSDYRSRFTARLKPPSQNVIPIRSQAR